VIENSSHTNARGLPTSRKDMRKIEMTPAIVVLIEMIVSKHVM